MNAYVTQFFFKLKNNAGFQKTMKNVRKQRYQTCHSRNKKELFSIRLSSTKFFTEHLLAIEMKYINKFSISKLSKILTYQFWYGYLKYGKKANCVILVQIYFIIYTKTNDIYKHIAEDVETRFDTSKYELE